MARPKSKTTTADLLALIEVHRLLRDEIRPILRRLKATYCLKRLAALQRSVRSALQFRSRGPDISNPRIVLLTEEIFREHLLPRLRPGYAATLAEYQAKNPDATHGLFMGKRLIKLGREKRNAKMDAGAM